MPITAKDIAALREQTGVGMMECKKALTEAQGDMEKAVVLLRERGLAAAAKKAGRVAAEGIVYSYVTDCCGTGVVIEVNIETDFAANNVAFQKFVKDLAAIVAKENPADVDALKALPYPDTDGDVAAELQSKVLTIGENIQIRRFSRYDGGKGIANASYIHMGGKIGVLVKMEVAEGFEKNADVLTLGKDICMQIAAMRPTWVSRDEVPADKLESEKEILMAQTLNEGKPAAVAEKIVTGRMRKFYEEFCLVDQLFIRDNETPVTKIIDAASKAIGTPIKVISFVRYEKGEGIAKKEDNFAAEVAGMVK